MVGLDNVFVEYDVVPQGRCCLILWAGREITITMIIEGDITSLLLPLMADVGGCADCFGNLL